MYEPLANAVASLSARNMARNEPSYFQAAVDFKIKALNCLRQDLVYRGISEYSIMCMIILGNIEINEQNTTAWYQHLDGAAKGVSEILAKNDIFASPTNYENFLTLLDALAFQDIFSGMSLCIRPRLNEVYSTQWKDLTRGVGDHYHGLRKVMATLSDIICLAAELQDSHPSLTYHLGHKYNQYYCVDKQLYSPENNSAYNKIVSEIANFQSPTSSSSDTSSLFGVFRYAVEIYFLLRFEANEFSYQLSPRIQELKQQALYWLSRLSPSTNVAISLSIVFWLFGMITDTAYEREMVFSRIMEIHQQVPQNSLNSVMNFLTTLWKMRDAPVNQHYPYRDLFSLVTEQTGFRMMM